MRASCQVFFPVWCWLVWLWFGHLDFVGIPLLHPPPLPPGSFVCLATCMSQNTSQEHDVVELALDFADLSISIRGQLLLLSGGTLAHLLVLLLRLLIPPVAIPVPHLCLQLRAHNPAFGGLAASFPECPQRWLRLSSRLGASNLSSEARITRAWIAGCWARAVVDQRIGSPNRSTACSLSNRYWVVVRCEGLRTPRIFTSSRRFFAAVGEIEGSSTVCHAFPSETEAAVYLDAANCTFPSSFD